MSSFSAPAVVSQQGIPIPKALVFDIGGTVFDWVTAISEVLGPLIARKGLTLDSQTFAFDWRAGFLSLYEEIAAGRSPWMDAAQIVAKVLDDLHLRYSDLDLTSEEEGDLRRAWEEMPAWSDAAPALARLRKKTMIAPFTILTWKMAAGSSKRSGIAWDGIFSCDLLGIYKPAPESYQRVGEILRLPLEEVMMVAAHPSDLRSAKTYGLQTAYVLPKLEDPGEDYLDRGFVHEFDLVAADFEHLADLLGC